MKMAKIPKLRQDVKKESALEIRMTGSPDDFNRVHTPSCYEIHERPGIGGSRDVACVFGRKVNLGPLNLGYLVKRFFELGDHPKNVGYAFTPKSADKKAYKHAQKIAGELSKKYGASVKDLAKEDIEEKENIMQEYRPGWSFYDF